MCVDRARDFVGFSDAEGLVQKFKEILAFHHINIPDDSDLGIACGAMTGILLKHWDPALRDPQADVRHEFRDALAIHALVSGALSASERPDFEEFLPHYSGPKNSDQAIS